MIGGDEEPLSRENAPRAEELEWLRRILEIVRERRGVDLEGYRTGTLLRRVRNRMIAAGVDAPIAYLERLRDVPGEADALLERLTIKVSRFFRDATTFEVLRRALAARRAEAPGAALRVWSAGCGQGEEPYSLAMLLAEELGPAETPDVLATDLDPAALSVAVRGIYAAPALAELPADVAARHLEEIPGPHASYAVGPAIRRRVEFRRHDLAGSASAPDGRRFDLVCCRNVLIYLGPRLQEHVERVLLESLVPGGLLLLGEAEWPLAPVAERLDVVDRRARLFRLRGGSR